MLVFSGSRFKILFDLEQVLFVRQGFLLLVSKFLQRVVVAVVVDQLRRSPGRVSISISTCPKICVAHLVITLHDRLSNPLDNLLQLLGRRHHTRLNQLQLGCERLSKFLHERLVLTDVL